METKFFVYEINSFFPVRVEIKIMSSSQNPGAEERIRAAKAAQVKSLTRARERERHLILIWNE